MTVTFSRTFMIKMKAIYSSHKENIGLDFAQKWRKKIFDKIKYLETFPQMGPHFESLEDYKNEIRYLTEGHYKIIYEFTGKQIFVLSIIDTRRNNADIKLF